MVKIVPKVKCVTKHCNFWLPGDFCVAGYIEITNNENGREAASVDETMCKMFSARTPEIELDEKQNEDLENLLTDSGSEEIGIHPEVKCIVDSCKYWGAGDKCVKAKIEILYTESKTPQETACEDYKERGGELE